MLMTVLVRLAGLFKTLRINCGRAITRPVRAGCMGHLPINYLYRHAIELYLKSMIIVAHRRLRLPSTDGAYEPIPKIKVVNNFKKIHNVHGIQALYDEMKRIFVTNRDLIAKIAKTDWTKIPEDLETSIATVGKRRSWKHGLSISHLRLPSS
jgi:hypothetical protein